MPSNSKISFYVSDFKKWRLENYSLNQIAINDVDDVSYPKWDELELLFADLIQTKQISKLDREDNINLLYLIARGWDCNGFLYELSEERPISSRGDLSDGDFIKLAKVAVTLTGKEYNDAKSQIASCFKKLNYLTPEIETILLKLYDDKEEYTKRQALISLAKLGYTKTPELIEKSWTLDNEWHQIGCLNVLDQYIDNKALLKSYLANTTNDVRQDISQYVLELKRKNNC